MTIEHEWRMSSAYCFLGGLHTALRSGLYWCNILILHYKKCTDRWPLLCSCLWYWQRLLLAVQNWSFSGSNHPNCNAPRWASFWSSTSMLNHSIPDLQWTEQFALGSWNRPHLLSRSTTTSESSVDVPLGFRKSKPRVRRPRCYSVGRKYTHINDSVCCDTGFSSEPTNCWQLKR
jgi:hypothetical protein